MVWSTVNHYFIPPYSRPSRFEKSFYRTSNVQLGFDVEMKSRIHYRKSLGRSGIDDSTKATGCLDQQKTISVINAFIIPKPGERNSLQIRNYGTQGITIASTRVGHHNLPCRKSMDILLVQQQMKMTM